MIVKKGFTVTELIVVVVIVGILSALALPNFIIKKEKALDKEAKVTLALIQAAEKIYKMETGVYYPESGTASDISLINAVLRLNLPDSGTLNWAYKLSNSTVKAERRNRTWTLNQGSISDEPVCDPCEY